MSFLQSILINGSENIYWFIPVGEHHSCPRSNKEKKMKKNTSFWWLYILLPLHNLPIQSSLWIAMNDKVLARNLPHKEEEEGRSSIYMSGKKDFEGLINLVTQKRRRDQTKILD